MDPQAETNEAPVTPQPIPELPKKDNHGITIAAMAIFVLLALGAVAFLYYQNQQLKTILAGYQTQPSSTPAATADPTANWKTYMNNTYGFSFKYPQTWKEATDSAVIGKNYREFRILTDKGEFVNGVVFDKADAAFTEQPWSKQIKLSLGKVVLVTYTDSLGPGSKGGTQDIQLFDQILSTFKFISPTASPSAKPVACTTEAKICPDGSSVGRTGPNCEFAPCPY